jgi:4'-phosphopantetheinyl transferase
MIELWAAFHDDELDPAQEAGYLDLLDAGERAQRERFHFARDRTRYLVTRALVRVVLGRHAPIGPADWRFRAGRHGRPEICNAHVSCRGLEFNISHTRGLVVLAVTRDRPVGVDVEHLHARPFTLDIAERYFAAQELRSIQRLPPAERNRRCFEHWIFKEAYLKARGVGLTAPLDAVQLAFGDGTDVALSADPVLADERPDRWHLWQLQLSPDHLVAVCAGGPRPQLQLRSVVPLQAETLLPPRILRCHHPPEPALAAGAM